MLWSYRCLFGVGSDVQGVASANRYLLTTTVFSLLYYSTYCIFFCFFSFLGAIIASSTHVEHVLLLSAPIEYASNADCTHLGSWSLLICNDTLTMLLHSILLVYAMYVLHTQVLGGGGGHSSNSGGGSSAAEVSTDSTLVYAYVHTLIRFIFKYY
jgi:hypothetical protein